MRENLEDASQEFTGALGAAKNGVETSDTHDVIGSLN